MSRVHIQTSDHLELVGEQYEGDRRIGGTAMLVLPGGGTSSYVNKFMHELAVQSARAGIPAVVANTRGREVISIIQPSNPSTARPRLLGHAYERFSDCDIDYAAWLDYMRSQGFERLVVVGHSLGCAKILATLGSGVLSAQSDVVLIGPNDPLAIRNRADPDGKLWRRALDLYLQGEGGTLIAHPERALVVTAESYVEMNIDNGPADVCPLRNETGPPSLAKLSGRLLVALGSKDRFTTHGPDRDAELILDAATSAKSVTYLSVGGASHTFATSGAKELIAGIMEWVDHGLRGIAVPRRIDVMGTRTPGLDSR